LLRAQRKHACAPYLLFMIDIDRSWESLLRTPEEIVSVLGLLSVQPIEEAIQSGDLDAIRVGSESYVVYADFISWVVRQSKHGFQITDPDGQVWVLSDLRGVPGSPLNERLKESPKA